MAEILGVSSPWHLGLQAFPPSIGGDIGVTEGYIAVI